MSSNKVDLDFEKAPSLSQSTDNNSALIDKQATMNSFEAEMLGSSDSTQTRPGQPPLGSTLPSNLNVLSQNTNSHQQEAGGQEGMSDLAQKEKQAMDPSLVTPPIGSNGSPQSPRTTIHHHVGARAQQETTMQQSGTNSGDGAPVVAPPPATHGFYTNADFAAAFAAAAHAPTVGSQLALAQQQQETPAPQPTAPNINRSAQSSKGKSRGVPHVYHDFSQVTGPGPAYIRKKTGGVTQPFPEKLHEMLNQESNDDPSSGIVSWLPHGRAFIVRRPKEFTSQIMPKHFRQTKLTSFQRQLNLYGFRRITQGADAGAYYHELFLQGRPSLSQRMVRQKVKGTGHKQPADVSSEPNFYAMPPVEPERHAEAFGARYKTTILPPGATAPPVATDTQADQATAAETEHHQESSTDETQVSPGLVSVQGAAHLLHGFASSFAAGGNNFLGAAAVDTSQGTTSADATSASDAATASRPEDRAAAKNTPASFLPPHAI